MEASYPLELVHMDYLKIGSKDDPNSNVLVITDHFTRFSQAYVTVNQQGAMAARVFVREFVNTGRERLIRSHSSARFCFELSGNSN